MLLFRPTIYSWHTQSLSRQDWSHEGSNLFPQMAQFGKNTGLQIFFKVQVKVFLAPRAFKQPISIVKSSLPFPVWSHQRSPLNENYTKRPFFRSCRNWTIWGYTLMKSLIYECNSRSKSYVFTLCVIVYFQRCKEGPYVPYDGITLVWIFENWIIKRRWSVNLGQRLDTKNALKSLIDTVL